MKVFSKFAIKSLGKNRLNQMIEAGDPQGLILFGPHEFKKIDLVMNILKNSIKCIIAT